MLQVARQMTDPVDGVVDGHRYLILIGTPSGACRCGSSWRPQDAFGAPFCAPNCNAFAARFVRSIKNECLDRMIPLEKRGLAPLEPYSNLVRIRLPNLSCSEGYFFRAACQSRTTVTGEEVASVTGVAIRTRCPSAVMAKLPRAKI